MEYYCVFIKCGEEERFKEEAKKRVSEFDSASCFYFFSEEAWSKKAKYKNKVVRPAFPGYVFFKVQKLTAEIIYAIKKIEGFIRFLPANHDIHKIEGAGANELIRFIEIGERHLMSKAVYEEGSRVRIVSGDMKMFEAYIVHWDPRHQKVRVRLPDTCITWSFELSYEIEIEKLSDDKKD